MSYTARLYLNTGFNTSNIPGTPDLLNTCSYVDATSNLEIIQDRFLTSIDVQVSSFSAVDDCDYARVHDFYYFVTNITMTSNDVAHLNLTPDFYTSAGGIMGFNILDGITTRVHVSDDTFGLADSGDEMLAPYEPLEIETVWKTPSSGGKTFIESTIDIEDTCQSGEAVTFASTVTAAYVCVPQTKAPSSYTTFTHASGGSEKHATKVYVTCTDSGTDTSQAQVGTYLATLRSLGLEQAIVNQVRIPNAYVTTSGGTAVISNMTGSTGTYALSEFPFIENTGIKNNLINYSRYLKYGLISCAGESCEYEPQDLHVATDTETYPTVKYVSDPHLDGKPYFRFSKINGDDSSGGFWRNCIGGMAWKQVPLTFIGASGSALNQLKFNNAQEIKAQQYNNAQQMRNIEYAQSLGQSGVDWGDSLAEQATGALIDGIGMLGQLASDIISNPANLITKTVGVVGSSHKQTQVDQHALYDYGAELKSELLDLAINNNVVVPTVNFPFNSHILQDQFDNGVLAYKYHYSSNDVTRIDKLLTMYGYKYSKPLESSDFTNRTYFNFIQCSNVTVTGRPRWWNDGIAAQLKGGIRIWHVLPSPSYYTNNPVA